MPNLNVTNIIRVLGPYGFTIYFAAKQYKIEVTDKEQLVERAPMTKAQFQQGWARLAAFGTQPNVTAGELIRIIAEGFESGAWSKEEVAACGWKQLFSSVWEGEQVTLGSIDIVSVSIGTLGGRPIVVVNQDMQVVPSRRSCKKVSDAKLLMTFFFGEERQVSKQVIPSEDPYKAHRRKSYAELPVNEWKLDYWIEYIYNTLNEKGLGSKVNKSDLMRISLIRNGVDALGIHMKERAPAKKRTTYKKFVDWLMTESPYRDSLVPANFVSKGTMIAWQIQGGTTQTASDGSREAAKDYSDGAQVTF